jgi:hypothetical protein
VAKRERQLKCAGTETTGNFFREQNEIQTKRERGTSHSCHASNPTKNRAVNNQIVYLLEIFSVLQTKINKSRNCGVIRDEETKQVEIPDIPYSKQRSTNIFRTPNKDPKITNLWGKKCKKNCRNLDLAALLSFCPPGGPASGVRNEKKQTRKLDLASLLLFCVGHDNCLKIILVNWLIQLKRTYATHLDRSG